MLQTGANQRVFHENKMYTLKIEFFFMLKHQPNLRIFSKKAGKFN